MRTHVACLGSIAALCSSTFLPADLPAEEVNLSRYRATVVMPAQVSADEVYELQAVDMGRVAGLCEDDDGCTLRVRMTGAAGFSAGERTLFKTGANWLTNGVPPEAGVDQNNDATDVLLIGPGNGNFCDVSDLDSIINGDDSLGFSLIAYFSGSGGSTAGFTCVLTLID